MDKIYELFKDQYGYIPNLEEIISYLKSENKNENEIVEILLKIYSNNNQAKNEIQKKNHIIETMNDYTPPLTNAKNDTNENTSSDKKQTTNKKNLNVEHYIYMLNKGFDLDSLKKTLPKDTEQLDNIINTIILHYIKERTELLNIANENSYNELKELINEEITTINNKIKTLISYRDSISKDIKEEDIKLIFTHSILNDFENSNIPREAYKDFLSLILSFKNGLPKNSKIFKPNGCAYIVSEVRFNGLRILYDKIDDSTYCLYYAFSKDENDTYYHDTLVYRTNLYYSNKKEVLDNKSVTENEESAIKLIKMLKGEQYGRIN